VFAAQTLPSLVTSLFYEKRPTGYVAVRAASGVLQTIGLAVCPLELLRNAYLLTLRSSYWSVTELAGAWCLRLALLDGY
jgi:hypothetical protein